MNKQWCIKKLDRGLSQKLSQSLGVDPLIAQLLINRNISDAIEAGQFLSAGLKDLYDPFMMKGMDKAVKRIKKSAQRKETVLIFGDYDADGVTASVLLNQALRKLGINVINHIPHRIDHGYGLNHEIAQYAQEKNVSLLISVDCGINASEEVETFKRLGIDVIVVDHHEPDNDIPRALAVVDPKQSDCPYPFKELAAVGLVAKLIQALGLKLSDEVLELTAIGTIADVVPMIGENRIFVKSGLSKIPMTRNKGLAALLRIAKITKKEIKPFHVGFILGPRINAAGRMDSAHDSLDLFLSDDHEQAEALAMSLEQHNVLRQKKQRAIIQEAFDMVESEVNFNEYKVIVVHKEGWHKGVLGIVASRLTEKYYRPAIVISVSEGIGTASARSIDGFHLYEALADCAECLEKFGGHEGAAGLTIKEDKIDQFRQMINDIAEEKLEINKLLPTISIDCEIPFDKVTMDLAETISGMEPFGEGNPVPIFCSRNLTIKSRPVTLARETIKFWVTDGELSISAVGFGMAKYKELVKLNSKVDLAYEISIDDWNKAPTVQLKLKDIKLSD